MNPSSLLLNNKPYSYEEIKSGNYSISTSFEQRSLEFCQQWLSGKQEFEQKTSGSTGAPKVIKISRTQMKISAEQTIKALSLKSNDIALVCIDTAYIGGKMMLVRALEHHLQLIIQEPTSNPLEKINVPFDFTAMVPLQFANSINTSIKKIHPCKAIIIGGAGISTALEKKILPLTTPIYSTYGMTETISHIALKRLSNPAEKHFTTLNDIRVKVNKRNQLIINGAITNHKDLITNDIVELLSPSTFKWLGRIDNIINSGGIKIQLEVVEKEVATLFLTYNITNRFFLYGVADDILGQKLVLCLETKGGITQSNLLEILTSNLKKISSPKKIIYIPQFIESSLGKLLKNESYKSIH